jgi:hypothetical protein
MDYSFLLTTYSLLLFQRIFQNSSRPHAFLANSLIINSLRKSRPHVTPHLTPHVRPHVRPHV